MEKTVNATPTKADTIRTDGVALIREHRSGTTAKDLSARLDEVLQDIGERGGKGKVELVIAIEPDKSHGDHAVAITCTVTSKPPKRLPTSDFRFLTDAGVLTKKDPDQPELDLNEKA